MRSCLLRIFAFALCLTALTICAFAQEGRYKPGDKIQYKVMGAWPERWETGTYVGSTPGGRQPIIREKPNEFYPEGSQRAASWDTIRPAAQPPKEQPPKAQPPKQDPDPPEPQDDPPPDNGADGEDEGNGCAALLGENEVLGYLERRLGNTPFRDPAKKERTERELAKMIRDCGLNFRYQNLSTFSTNLDKYGATSIVRFPLSANLGQPTKQAWYIGTWLNNVQSENYWSIIAAKTGFLTISANGTYIWKLYATDPPADYVKGRWRAATYDEMAAMYQGGSGVVLLNGKSGLDWIVRQDRNTTLKGRWIVTSDLRTHQMREFGYQK